MSIVSKLAKYKNQAANVKANDGNKDLPLGNYVGVITKGEIVPAKETKSQFGVFSVKISEGEHKNKPGRISQNLVKKDEDLNEIGVGIIKGIFIEMFGKGDARVHDITEWDKLFKLSVGYRLKFSVYTRNGSDQVNYKINAVLPREDGAAAPAAEKSDAPEKEEEKDEIPMDYPAKPEPKAKAVKKAKATKPAPEVDEEEPSEEEATPEAATEEETTTEEGHSEEEVRSHLKSLSRADLLKFIKEHAVEGMVNAEGKIVGTVGLSEEKIVEKIIVALQ